VIQHRDRMFIFQAWPRVVNDCDVKMVAITLNPYAASWDNRDQRARSDHCEAAMRLLLFMSGVFAAIVCIEKPAEAQNGAWCGYYNGGGGDGDPHCRYTTLEQCVADMRPTGGSCGPSPYPTSPQSPPSTRPRRR
jgi:hypothetical protein